MTKEMLFDLVKILKRRNTVLLVAVLVLSVALTAISVCAFGIKDNASTAPKIEQAEETQRVAKTDERTREEVVCGKDRKELIFATAAITACVSFAITLILFFAFYFFIFSRRKKRDNKGIL